MNDINNIPDWCIPILVTLIFWSLFWKIIALWHAAKKSNRPWYFILFFFNSLGILELYYLFSVEKVKTKKLFK